MARHHGDEDRNEPKTAGQRALWALIFCFVGVSVLASVIMAIRLMTL